MILKIQQDTELPDFEISLKYSSMNKKIERIITYLKSVDAKIECKSKNSIKQVDVSDIYYIESIDKQAVVFCEKEKFHTNFRLYQLNELLRDKGFVQISKYCILNTNKLEKFMPLANSRMEAILTNGARLFINRNYLVDIKKMLQEDL